MALRRRELSVRQRTQLINAVRGHLGELGQVAPQGASNIRKLVALVDSGDSTLPNVARECLERLIATLNELDGQIKELDAEIARRAGRWCIAQPEHGFPFQLFSLDANSHRLGRSYLTVQDRDMDLCLLSLRTERARAQDAAAQVLQPTDARLTQ